MREYKIITKNNSVFLVTVIGKELRITSIDGKHSAIKDNRVITLDKGSNEKEVQFLINNKYYIPVSEFEKKLQEGKDIIFFEILNKERPYGWTSNIGQVWLRLV
mgnify:FL=1